MQKELKKQIKKLVLIKHKTEMLDVDNDSERIIYDEGVERLQQSIQSFERLLKYIKVRDERDPKS